MYLQLEIIEGGGGEAYALGRGSLQKPMTESGKCRIPVISK